MKGRFTIKLLLCVSTMIALASCSSPADDGAKAAKLENQYADECIEEVHSLESKFVADFNPGAYSHRQEALDEYTRQFKNIYDNYDRNLDLAAIQTSKLKGRYSSDYKDIREFEDAYAAAKNYELLATAEMLRSMPIPSGVIASINMILPPTPNPERIMRDFAGHTLSEGFERYECYFSENWFLTVGQEVSISDLKIDNVVRKDNSEYVVTTSFILSMEYITFNAKAQIYYSLPSGSDWKMEFVKSLGIRIIPTDKYKDCIRCVIEDDGWGGIDALFISNTSEVQLLVVGKIKTQNFDEPMIFNKIIPAGQKVQVGGLFGGSVTDYEIILVERES